MIDNAAYSGSSSGDEDNASQIADDLEFGQDVYRKHQNERKELRKSPQTLATELSSLIKDVTSGALWPQQMLIADNSAIDDFNPGFQLSKVVSDAFKEAFISQLSYIDIIELLETSQVDY